MENKQQFFLCCVIIILSASKGLALKRDFTDEYQHEHMEVKGDDSQADDVLWAEFMTGMNQINTCIGKYFGSSYKLQQWTNNPARLAITSRVLAKKFLVKLLQSFHGHQRKELENSCRKFNTFAQCSYNRSEAMGQNGLPVVDHIIAFLQGVIGFICDDGFNRYHKYFANSGCIDDIMESSFEECLTANIQSKFFDAADRFLSLPNFKDNQEIILKHFLCMASSVASCVESEIDSLCADSRTGDVWVTMFNKGVEKVLKKFSLPIFIPNPTSCEPIETEFFTLSNITETEKSQKKDSSLTSQSYACLKEVNNCIGIHFGTKYDKYDPQTIVFLHQTFQLVGENLLSNLIESFLSLDESGFDVQKQLHKSCSKFNSFTQSLRKMFEETGCTEFDKPIMYLEGIIGYICNDGFDKYLKHIIFSYCLTDTLEISECFSTAFDSKLLEATFSLPMLLVAQDGNYTEIIVHYCVCMQDNFVSCVKREIDSECSDDQMTDFMVTMFNKGAEKIFKHYSLPVFIPNATLCQSVEKKFLTLVKSVAASNENVFAKLLQKVDNEKIDCSITGMFMKLSSCFLAEYPNFVGKMAENAKHFPQYVMDSICMGAESTGLLKCFRQYKEACPEIKEVDLIIGLIKSFCDLSFSVLQSPCTSTDVDAILVRWILIEEMKCEKPLLKNLAILRSMDVLETADFITDEKVMQCSFDAFKTAMEGVEDKCGSKVALILHKFMATLQQALKYSGKYLIKVLGDIIFNKRKNF